MNIDKDYYAILGVLPSAEEIVIKAAYRALSKRYHPDIYKGTNLAEKMSDINEAYEVLSSAISKSEYDTARGARSQDADEYFNDDFGTHNTVDPLDDDWKVAIKYHPYLEETAASLTKYSKKLAYAYKAYMLETKDFENMDSKARAIVQEFLELHFGKNKEIISFAKRLFSEGRTDILIELNKAIKVLGASNADARMISKIKDEFNYKTSREQFDQWFETLDGHEWIDEWNDERTKLYKTWKLSVTKAKAEAHAIIEEATRQSESAKNFIIIGTIGLIMLFAFIAMG